MKVMFKKIRAKVGIAVALAVGGYGAGLWAARTCHPRVLDQQPLNPPLSFPKYPLPPSIFSGYNSLFSSPIVYEDADPTWQFDAKLFARYSKRKDITTQQQWATLPSGVNATPRKTPLIVSLTCWPPRIQYVWLTIESLMNQTCKPDRIILCLAQDEFRNGSLPLTLRLLQKRGLEIRFCPNWRSAKKLLPLKKEHDTCLLVTCDDDFWYQPHWLKGLYDKHLQDPRAIWTQDALHPIIDKEKRIDLYNTFLQTPFSFMNFFSSHLKKSWHYIVSGSSMLESLVLGCAGVLYPPQTLHPDVWDGSAFLRLSARNDDVWFYAMALRNGTPINVVRPFFSLARSNQNVRCIEPNISQAHALWYLNLNSDGVGTTDRDFHTVFSFYGLYKKLGIKPLAFFEEQDRKKEQEQAAGAGVAQ